jgi:hypothetical protein
VVSKETSVAGARFLWNSEAETLAFAHGAVHTSVPALQVIQVAAAGGYRVTRPNVVDSDADEEHDERRRPIITRP